MEIQYFKKIENLLAHCCSLPKFKFYSIEVHKSKQKIR